MSQQSYQVAFANSRRDKQYVSDYSMVLLHSLMQQAGIRAIVITSTYRSPESQARVMYDNLAKSKSAKSMYAKHGKAVEAVFSQHKQTALKGIAEGFDPRRPLPLPGFTQAAMARQIRDLEQQHGEGCVSRHQADPKLINVLDIAEASVSPHGSIDNFLDVLTDSHLIARIGLPKGSATFHTKHFVETSPCIHLEIPQPSQADPFSRWSRTA